jgi:hypothetical protein
MPSDKPQAYAAAVGQGPCLSWIALRGDGHKMACPITSGRVKRGAIGTLALAAGSDECFGHGAKRTALACAPMI